MSSDHRDPRLPDERPRGLEPVLSGTADRLRKPAELALDGFLSLLPFVDWFAACGNPNPRDVSVERVFDWSECPVGNEAGRQRMNGVLNEWGRQSGRSIRGADQFDWWKADRPEVRSVEKFVNDSVRPKFGDGSRGAAAAAGIARQLLSQVMSEIAVRITREMGLPPALQSIWEWYLDGHWPCAFYRPRELGVSRLLVY